MGDAVPQTASGYELLKSSPHETGIEFPRYASTTGETSQPRYAWEGQPYRSSAASVAEESTHGSWISSSSDALPPGSLRLRAAEHQHHALGRQVPGSRRPSAEILQNGSNGLLADGSMPQGSDSISSGGRQSRAPRKSQVVITPRNCSIQTLLEESAPSRGSDSSWVKGSARSKLKNAEVATSKDRDYLANALKCDINSVKILGEGAFGIVDLVVVDTSKGGLLCVRKKLLKQNDKNTCDPGLEVVLMEACQGSAFVVQLWSHVVGLYDYTLLLEYCPYSTLQDLLNAVCENRSKSGIGCWDFFSSSLFRANHQAGLLEFEARFYIACVVLGIEALHKQGILHRDLKPSNCLIAYNLYVKVADLGLAKKLGQDGRAHAAAGTQGYMAPEIVHAQGKSNGGYGYPADIWSMGVMLWEMVDGALPKWAPMSWYWTSLHFPPHFSKELNSLLGGLLDKSPSKRITIPEIKSHAWFKGFDWDALSQQCLPAANPPELESVHIHVKLLPEDMRSTAVPKQPVTHFK